MDTNIILDENIKGQMSIEEMLNGPAIEEALNGPKIEEMLQSTVVEEPDIDIPETVPDAIHLRDLYEKYTKAFSEAVTSGVAMDATLLFRENVRTRHYVDMASKIDLANNILETAMTSTNEQRGYRFYDKTVGETAIALAIVKVYTSIDTSDGEGSMDAMEIFDMLSAMNLIEYLRANIDDVARFEHVCECTIHSLEKTYGIDAMIADSIADIRTRLVDAIDRFSNAVEGFTPEHIEEVNNLLGRINESVKAVKNR